jgi:hypothetical protein
LIFLKLKHKYLSYVVAEAWVIPENASDKVLTYELVPVYQMLKVDFK